MWRPAISHQMFSSNCLLNAKLMVYFVLKICYFHHNARVQYSIKLLGIVSREIVRSKSSILKLKRQKNSTHIGTHILRKINVYSLYGPKSRDSYYSHNQKKTNRITYSQN